MALVILETGDSIGTLTFNCDRRRNALSSALVAELIGGLEALEKQGARCAILRANPGVKVWSAGHDVRELPRCGRDPLAYDDPLERVIRAVRRFPAPVIAMIEGSVWGGACELALCCDMLVGSPTASFALTPAKIGVPYNVAGLLRIMSEVDLSVCKEMFFTALPIPAERALRVGILNHLVPADEIETFTREIATRITTLSPLSIAVIKKQLATLSDARSLSPDTFERIQELRRKVYESHDYEEGVLAFLEKRPPVWQHSKDESPE